MLGENVFTSFKQLRITYSLSEELGYCTQPYKYDAVRYFTEITISLWIREVRASKTENCNQVLWKISFLSA